MKMYFTAEEMHTDEYRKYVQWVSECWRLNDERNRRIEAEKRHRQLMDDFACIDEGDYA